ncbi:MAG: hypothetical protein GY762_18785 [Proteobacteria bacterium]|nr:hypothetical protein [Pseudomonadota bacterium]
MRWEWVCNNRSVSDASTLSGGRLDRAVKAAFCLPSESDDKSAMSFGTEERMTTS